MLGLKIEFLSLYSMNTLVLSYPIGIVVGFHMRSILFHEKFRDGEGRM